MRGLQTVRRLSTACDDLIVSGSQRRFIGLEMPADRNAVDCGAECAVQVAHEQAAVLEDDRKMIARQPNRFAIVEQKVRRHRARRLVAEGCTADHKRCGAPA